MEETANMRDMIVEIVAAYVSKNSIPALELPALISSVHKSMLPDFAEALVRKK